MPRPKGLPKTGGRQKGTPNKFCRARLIETLQEHGIDPTVELIKLLPSLPIHQKAGIYIDWQRELLKEKEPGKQDDRGSNPADRESVDDLISALRATHEANQARALHRAKT